ncbi:aminoglycoside phosphotransferase [Hirsutella rhossiliensis]|uniref:Aminoglycoside phosphotransferase n=1 Tax=Hirsutella rhossiliensis TaxID=111463 RepID=A0A9P8MT95_9HYPO|nr:Aminoglycoside phosphotransferase [Hirsutella rhossiliensis]KAH0960880.1 Aminoglycoside phosphotransferase [Hirsutella rhossiliensis]
MPPCASLPLLAGRITLSEALDAEDDILEKLSYPEKRLDFCSHLHAHADEIETIVSHHLHVSRDSCRAPWVDEWVHGSFNIGESTHPGNADEKLRCEVATYAWIQAHCPWVPIPRLWGFGFPGGPIFTALDRAPLVSQLGWYIRRSLLWMLGRPCPSGYVTCPRRLNLSSGYLVVDFVQHGRMLSETWDALRQDDNRRKTIHRDISRIMLELARVPFPRIGSLTMDNHAVVSLTNRPLTLNLHQLENEGLQTNIARDLTYATADTYLLDLLACHDHRIRHLPNAILDYADGQSQLSALTIMRALLPHFTDRELRHGPFVLMLTDLHPSNRACSRPVEMLLPPHWLTGRAIDQITGEHLVAYGQRLDEFVSVFEEEEKTTAARDTGSVVAYADAMRTAWETGRFWYMSAVEASTGLYNLFLQHIQPIYGDAATEPWKEFERLVAPYWAPGSSELISRKVHERERYLEQIREAFGRGASEG